MNRFLLHFVLASIWILMFGSFDPYSLVAGLLVAHLVIAVLGRSDARQRFRGNPWRLIRFVAFFIRIVVVANWNVAKLVLSPAMPIHPRILRYDVSGMTPVELTAFAGSITLTPGTLAFELSPDDRFLYIHCMDAPDRAQALRELDVLRERLMTEVFA